MTSTRLLLILPWSSGMIAPWPSRGFLVIATLDYNAQTPSETWYNCGQNTQPLPIPTKSAGCLHSQVILICGWQMPNITDLSSERGAVHCDGMQRKHLKSTPPGHQATCPGTNFSPRKLWSFFASWEELLTQNRHKDSSFGRFYWLVRRSYCRHWDLAGISHGGNRQPGNFNVSNIRMYIQFPW